jgi:hypothetical protein
MSAPGPDLPEDLENQLYEICLDAGAADRQARLAHLFAAAPDHAQALRTL